MTSYKTEDPKTIQALFDSIAKQYERTNAILSFNLHKRWNQLLVKEVLRNCENSCPKVFLDLCCGTGAIAFELLKDTSLKNVKAYLLDFSKQMLECAKMKANTFDLKLHEIKYLQADAQHIPIARDSVDCATIAYGIRNVQDPKKCLDETFRVLKKGGTFGILELTEPQNAYLKVGHSIYLRKVLPWLGKLLTSNKEAYQYLCGSIQTFIKPKSLIELMDATGFKEIRSISLLGGTATLLITRKPL